MTAVVDIQYWIYVHTTKLGIFLPKKTRLKGNLDFLEMNLNLVIFVASASLYYKNLQPVHF